MRKSVAILVVAFLSAIAFSLCSADENTPTIDLSNGHEYALLQKGGVTIQKSTYITSGEVRSSDKILDQSIVIRLAPEKSFTMEVGRSKDQKNVSPLGNVGIGKDDSVMQYLAFGVACPTDVAVKAKIKEIGDALGFENSEFDRAVDSGDLAKRTRWGKGSEEGTLCWVVEVKAPTLPGWPYGITVYIAWDKKVIEKLSPFAAMSRVPPK
jgi:hypothetical protein